MLMASDFTKSTSAMSKIGPKVEVIEISTQIFDNLRISELKISEIHPQTAVFGPQLGVFVASDRFASF